MTKRWCRCGDLVTECCPGDDPDKCPCFHPELIQETEKDKEDKARFQGLLGRLEKR